MSKDKTIMITESGLTLEEYSEITGKEMNSIKCWKYGSRNPEPINYKFIILYKELLKHLSKEDIFELLNKG
jgi:hypothetical protein